MARHWRSRLNSENMGDHELRKTHKEWAYWISNLVGFCHDMRFTHYSGRILQMTYQPNFRTLERRYGVLQGKVFYPAPEDPGYTQRPPDASPELQPWLTERVNIHWQRAVTTDPALLSLQREYDLECELLLERCRDVPENNDLRFRVSRNWQKYLPDWSNRQLTVKLYRRLTVRFTITDMSDMKVSDEVDWRPTETVPEDYYAL